MCSDQPSHEQRQLREALDLLPLVACGRAAVSLNALPYVLPARHLVQGRHLLLRVTYGLADHRSLDGTVLSYEANTYGGPPPDHRGHFSAQLVGTARVYHPTVEEQRHLGPWLRYRRDGNDTPVHLRVTPHLATVRRPRGTVPAPRRPPHGE